MRNRIVLLSLPLLAVLSLGCSDGATVTGSSGNNQTPESDASISAVIPNKVFLARMADVTISGFGTNWVDATKVDFGTGITVLNQTVASPTAIVVTIDVAADAAVGARDVKVTDAGGTTTYKGAFKTESPLDLTFTGTVAQGSIVATTAKQLDLSTPFDTTSTGDGLFSPIVYTNVNISGSQGINSTVNDVALYSTSLVTYIDIDTPADKGDLTVNSGPLGNTIPSPASKAVDVAARMPEALTDGTAAKGKIDQPLASLLYSFTPAGPGLYSIVTSASSVDANPNVAVLPKSGHFTDLMDFSDRTSILATNTDPYYFVYWDNSGEFNYNATVKAAKVTPADVDPNDTCAQAQPAGNLPALIKDLYLSSETDVDWFSFTVAAGDEGKIVHVKTTAGDTKTDAVVEVFELNCTTSLGGPSADGDYHEDFKSDPIVMAGQHFVKVTNSTFGYSGKLYNLSIAVEAAP